MSTPHEVARDPTEVFAMLTRELRHALRLRDAEDGGYPEAFGCLRAAVSLALYRMGLPPVVDDAFEDALAAMEGPRVSDADAEATADAACGAPVDSAVSRAYVGPGPGRLKARFRW